jgi:hypothetical protein
MLKFDNTKRIPEAFNLTTEEVKLLHEVTSQLATTKGESTITWAMERLWIDERFSDNLKAVSIYLLGYTKCLQDILEGGERRGRD